MTALLGSVQGGILLEEVTADRSLVFSTSLLYSLPPALSVVFLCLAVHEVTNLVLHTLAVR